MKNFKKTVAYIFMFCLNFIIIGCAGSLHQAEAKTKEVRKGVTYETDSKELCMDISKLTPKEGEAALNKLSAGKYGNKLLSVYVKAENESKAEKNYIKWGKEFQKLASNKYRLLPFSSDINIRKLQKKGYYKCFDTALSPVYTYHCLNQYIDNIFAFRDAEKFINGSNPIGYFENFAFKYTDPAGEKHTKKISIDYMNFAIESVYSEILSKEQFAKASDAVRAAFLLFPRKHFTTYSLKSLRSDCDIKKLADKQWKGVCVDYCILTHQLAAYLSFDIKCQYVSMDFPNHAIAFVRAKNSSGSWEFFETDNEDTYFDYNDCIRYSEVIDQSKGNAFLAKALQYMRSSPTPELTAMTTEHDIKKGMREGCLDTTAHWMLSSLANKWMLSNPNSAIEYEFMNQNDEKYGCAVIKGTCLAGEASSAKKISASVKHIYDGEIKYTRTITAVILKTETNEQISTSEVSEISFHGYKFDHITINGETVDSLPEFAHDGDVIIYHYVKDLTLTKTLTATVRYYKNDSSLGNVLAATELYKKEVGYFENVMSTEGISDRAGSFSGYKLSKITVNGEKVSSIPDFIEKETEICYYYVKDSSDTKTLTATVQYILIDPDSKEEMMQENDTFTYKEEVDASANSYIKPGNIPIKEYDGYKVAHYFVNGSKSTASTWLKASIRNGSVIKVYYEADWSAAAA